MSDTPQVETPDRSDELMDLQFALANDYKYLDPDEISVSLITEVRGNHKILINAFDGQLRPVSGDGESPDIAVFKVATATLALSVKGALGLHDQLTAVVKDLVKQGGLGSDNA